MSDVTPPIQRASAAHCALCNTPLAGRYCHACGQKRIEPGDRSLRALLGTFWHELTSLDGRALASFRDLLLRPGQVSAAWIAGRQQRYLMPLTLFLLVNLVYFLRAPMTDFNLSLADQACLQPWAASATAWVDARIAPEAMDCTEDPRPGSRLAELSTRYTELSGDVSQSFVIAHVPVLALFLAALAGRRGYFADHIVVGLHLMAYLMLLAVLAVPVAWLLVYAVGRTDAIAIGVRIGLAILLLGHWTLAVRRAYGLGVLRTVVAPLLLLVGLGISHFVYRWAQFWIVAWQLG